MNIVSIKYFFIGFMVSELPSIRIRALSIFGYFPLYLFKKIYFIILNNILLLLYYYLIVPNYKYCLLF